MTTRIGLLGDVHAIAAPVAEALKIFHAEGVDEIWCTGDVAGYGNQLEETIELLEKGSCQVILGNHDDWYLARPESEQNNRCADYLVGLPRMHESVIEGKYALYGARQPTAITDGWDKAAG